MRITVIDLFRFNWIDFLKCCEKVIVRLAVRFFGILVGFRYFSVCENTKFGVTIVNSKYRDIGSIGCWGKNQLGWIGLCWIVKIEPQAMWDRGPFTGISACFSPLGDAPKNPREVRNRLESRWLTRTSSRQPDGQEPAPRDVTTLGPAA